MQCHHVVIPGYDQESDSRAVGCVLLSQAFVLALRQVP